MVPILELAEAKVCSCSVNDRVGVFDASISSALDSKAVDVAAAAPRLASLIFQTLPVYSDRRSQASVERALTKALKRETAFVKAFAGALVQACAKPGSVSASVAGLVRYKLLKWSCLLLRERGDAIVGVRAAFSRLVVAQGTLLTVALGDEPRLKRASLHAVNEMLGAVPSLAAAYLAEIKSTPVTLTTVGIAHPLLTYYLETKARKAGGTAAADGVANGTAEAASAPGSAAEAKAFFVETYSKLVLSSRERPPHVASEAFAPLLHSLEHSEFKGTLFPTAAKMLKRNPELIMDAVGYLLSTVRLDLSAYAPELLPTLALQARHQNAATREEAIGVFAVAAKQCSDSDSIRTMFAYLKGVLAGKEGKLTSAYQKVGVYQTLRALSSFSPAGPNAMAPAVAADVAEFLMTAYAGDTNEEVLAAVLSALGEWLARTARQAPAATSAFVTARLAKEKETLRRCTLRCLRLAFRNPHVREKLVPCVDALVALVKSGVAKPTMRLDGVYALLLAASVAALDLGSEEKLTKEKVWQLVLQGEPPFLSTSIVPKVTAEEDLLALLELVEVVLLHHTASVSTGHAAAVSTNELCRLAVHLLWHPLSSVRKAAHAMVARFHAISPLLSDSLLDALALSLPPLEDIAAAAAISTGDAPEAGASPESAADRLPPPQLLGQALLVVAGTGAVAERVGVAARVMLLAHHRLVAGGRKRDVVWQELIRAWQRRAYEVSATLAAEPVVVAKILTGPAGLASSRPAQSDAAISAIQSAMRLIPFEFFQPLVTELEAVGQRKEHDALTESEIKIFNTPEGMLSAEDGVYVAAVVRDKNVRQSRGKLKLYGADLDDDDEEEEPSKPAPAAATAKKSATATPAARGGAGPGGAKGAAGRGAGKKDTGKPGAKKAAAGEGEKGKTAKEEAREALLLEEERVRERVRGIQRHTGVLVRALGAAAAANPAFSHDQLPQLVASILPLLRSPLIPSQAFDALALVMRCLSLVLRPSCPNLAPPRSPLSLPPPIPQVAAILPLLRSPLIPSQAFDALALVMRCLSPALQPFSWDVASALCSVSLAGDSLAEQLKEESAEEGEEEEREGKRRRKKEESVVDRVVRAVWAACKEGGSLPAATFGAVFPIFERVLRANKKTRLHDSIISILQLHTSPFIALPRLAMISVLYHVLGCVRIYHSRVQPILRELCRGLKSDEIGGVSCGRVRIYHSRVQPILRELCRGLKSDEIGGVSCGSGTGRSVCRAGTCEGGMFGGSQVHPTPPLNENLLLLALPPLPPLPPSPPSFRHWKALEGLFAEQAHVREACLEAVKYIPTLAAGKAPQDPYALEGLFAEQAHVREACLEAVKYIPTLAAGKAPQDPYVACAIWMAQYDPEPENAEAAEMVWDMYGHHLGPEYAPNLIVSLGNPSQEVRLAAAEAMAAAMDEYRGTIQASLTSLFSLYVRDAPPQTAMWRPQDDATWHSREGMALAMRAAADVLTTKELPLVATFLISKALHGDKKVQFEGIVAAGGCDSRASSMKGKENVGLLLPIFENYLDRKADNEHSYDLVREGVVVFLGALAKHLAPHNHQCHIQLNSPSAETDIYDLPTLQEDPKVALILARLLEEDPKVALILARLLEVLNTPSEAVQRAVSDCLPPLMPAISLKLDDSFLPRPSPLAYLFTLHPFSLQEGGSPGAHSPAPEGAASDRFAERKGARAEGSSIFSPFPHFLLPSSLCIQEGGAQALIAQQLKVLLTSDRFAERRGAAFGLAGVVKGLGLRSIRDYGVLQALIKGVEDKGEMKEGKVKGLGLRGIRDYGVLQALIKGVEDKMEGEVKGLGLRSIRDYGVLQALIKGVEDKSSPKAREGALFGFECLSEKLGRLFEPYVIHILPYVIHILPYLLVCYSDTATPVREATVHASRCIMGQLSAPGVKLILPALLKGLEEKAWRSKQGSVQLLGAMAFCAPRQLSHCLPLVVPKLSEVLTDTHPKVQAAAHTSLQQVGSVIRNPEIAALVPSLLDGIANPNKHTRACLDLLLQVLPAPLAATGTAAVAVQEEAPLLVALVPSLLDGIANPNTHTRACLDLLLQTTFVNSIDAAFPALVIPIVHRALREHSSDIKKRAAQIVGNTVSLVTDHSSLLPYLNLLLPGLNLLIPPFYPSPHPPFIGHSSLLPYLNLLLPGLNLLIPPFYPSPHPPFIGHSSLLPYLNLLLPGLNLLIPPFYPSPHPPFIGHSSLLPYLNLLLPGLNLLIPPFYPSPHPPFIGHSSLLPYLNLLLPLSRLKPRARCFFPPFSPTFLLPTSPPNQTTFVNSIDAASLALIIPIVHRALRERSSDIKKRAAQIVGNTMSLLAAALPQRAAVLAPSQTPCTLFLSSLLLPTSPPNQTTFVNSIDAASLALVIPIVHRALRERSSDIKKRAAQIVGNTVSLVTDHSSLLPYLNLLLPGLKKVLLDPHPDVRTVAAKAFGSLVRGVGEHEFPDLVPWMLETIGSDASSVERSGAAQGLSEVLGAQGRHRFEVLLPDLLAGCSHKVSTVRDGHLTLFKYLPLSFGAPFQNYLPQVLPAILDGLAGLADESESVRDAALAAGHVLVQEYAISSLPLLLPAVEEGLFNDNLYVASTLLSFPPKLSPFPISPFPPTSSLPLLLPAVEEGLSLPLLLPAVEEGLFSDSWRIRQSSMELLGDLLFKVAGTSGKVVLEGGSDDEGASTEAQGRAILDVLGLDRRNEVLAAVYIVRSDVSLSVRQGRAILDVLGLDRRNEVLAAVYIVRSDVSLSVRQAQQGRLKKGRAILDVLGLDRRNEVLAAVYIVRSDVSLSVRQSAVHVWKTIVANTPRTLKEIMPTLMRLLIDSLGSPSFERRQMASRAIGELVRKLGERVLPSVVPILSAGLKDPNPATRQGVCCGLGEVMNAAGRQNLTSHLDDLIGTIRTALCDEDAEVREAAAQAFSTLYKGMQVIDEIVPALLHCTHSVELTKGTSTIRSPPLPPASLSQPFDSPLTRSAGMQAIDEIVPALLHSLEDPHTSATALDGLKQILSVRTTVVLPHILPKLVKPPLTYVHSFESTQKSALEFKAHALGALAEVAGAGMCVHLATVLPPLLNEMGQMEESALRSMAVASAEAVVKGVDEEGLDSLIGELTHALSDNSAVMRRGAAKLLGTFCKITRVDLEEELPSLMTILIVMLADPDEACVKEELPSLMTILIVMLADPDEACVKEVEEELQSLMTILIVMLADPDEACVKVCWDEECVVYSLWWHGRRWVSRAPFPRSRCQCTLTIHLPSSCPPDPLSQVAWEALGSVTSTILKESLPVAWEALGSVTSTIPKESLPASAPPRIPHPLILLSPTSCSPVPPIPSPTQVAWEALGSVTSTIPKESLPASAPPRIPHPLILLSPTSCSPVPPIPSPTQVAWEALGSVTSTIPKESLPVHLKVARDAVATARDRERRKRKGLPMLVAGFCLPKGLQPVLQIYLQVSVLVFGPGSLMLGSAEMREAAADGLAELIDVASEAALRPFVVPITGWVSDSGCRHGADRRGEASEAVLQPFAVPITCPSCPCISSPLIPPHLSLASSFSPSLAPYPFAVCLLPPSHSPLIRIVGDRFPWQVKAAILSTLAILITKGGIALKPFLPQLQTTFIRCLQDSNRTVRSRAAKALGRLTALNPRVDALISDLLNSIQSADGAVKESTLMAIRGVVRHRGKGRWPRQGQVASEPPQHTHITNSPVVHASSHPIQSADGAVKESMLMAIRGMSADGAVKESMLMAIRGVVRHGGKAASPASLERLSSSLQGVLFASDSDDDSVVRSVAARALGGTAQAVLFASDGDHDSVVRSVAARALGGTAQVRESVCGGLSCLSSSLLALLFASDSDVDSVVRSVAARALGGTAQGPRHLESSALALSSLLRHTTVKRSPLHVIDPFPVSTFLNPKSHPPPLPPFSQQYLSEPDYLSLLAALAAPLPSSRPWSHRLAAALALSSLLRHTASHPQAPSYCHYLSLLAALAAPLPSSRPWSHRLAAALALSSLLRHTASRPAPLPASQLASVAEKSAAAIRAHAGDDKVPVRETAAKAAGRWLMLFGMGGGSAAGVVAVLASLLGDAASDVRRRALSAVKMVAKKVGQWASDVRRKVLSAVKMVAKKVSGSRVVVVLASLLGDAASDMRRRALSAVKMVAKKEPIPAKLLAALGPPLSECLKDTSQPVCPPHSAFPTLPHPPTSAAPQEPIPAKLLAGLGPPLSECFKDTRAHPSKAPGSTGPAPEPIPAKLLAALGPPLSECLKDTSQPVRLAAERTILHAFQLSKGPDQVTAAQKYLTGLESRRIAKMPVVSDGSDDSEDDDAQDY
ncbi:unnamed protein product [Closterium sp. Naga37s-1]|nr:unnamed protein product [Closterium sp. Naga37s-1]